MRRDHNNLKVFFSTEQGIGSSPAQNSLAAADAAQRMTTWACPM